MIYFIRQGRGPIKIGYSKQKDCKDRLNTLQSAHHKQLTIVKIIEGTPYEEKKLHKRFARYRIRGEWFKPGLELLEFIYGKILI